MAFAGRALYRRLTCYDFRGRTVLITGSSRGLGLVLARQLAAQGARIVLSARDTKELERAAADLLSRGADVLTVPCDITQADPVRSMIEQIDRQWGSIDVVINNAGTIQTGPPQ